MRDTWTLWKLRAGNAVSCPAGGSARLQPAIEYVSAFGVSLLILTMVVGIVGFILLSTNSGSAYTPASCYISAQINCIQFAVSNNGTRSVAVVVFSNNLGTTMSFPSNSIVVSPSPGQSMYTGGCYPATAAPGATVTCNATLSGLKPSVGSQLAAKFQLSYAQCTQGQCTSFNTTGTSTSYVSSNTPVYKVTLLTLPSGGNIYVDGAEYQSGSVVDFLYGETYYVKASAPAGYSVFYGWETEGGTYISNSISPASTSYTTASGELEASYLAPLVTYNGVYCDSGSVSGTSASCSVPASTSPGAFCMAAVYGSLNAPSWPVAQSAPGSFGNPAAMSGSGWTSGSACSATSTSASNVIEVGGLSVSSTGSISYGGQSGESATQLSSSSNTFTYSTDAGSQPEAVALMVACGSWACGSSITWPSGCSQEFLTAPSYDEALSLALCDQTEGSTYSVTIPGTGYAYNEGLAVSDIRFENGIWSTSGGSEGGSTSNWFGVDGSSSATFSSTNTGTVTLTTSNGLDVIAVYTGFETGSPTCQSVSSISDSAGLTWHKRSSVTMASDGYGVCDDQEVWYAISTGALSSDPITAHLTGSVKGGVVLAFGVKGANTGSPWDTNGALPATAQDSAGSGGAAKVYVSTTSANTMLLGFAGNDNYNWFVGSGGYGTITSAVNGGNSWGAGIAYEIANTPQSSNAITMASGCGCSTAYWSMIGDAIRASR